MTAVVTDQLVSTIYVRATPHQVWDALTNGQTTARYYYDSPVESTWQPGAEVVYFSPDRAQHWIDATILAIEPRTSLHLRMRMLFDPRCAADAPFEQRWELADAGAGVTRLTWSHAGVDPTSASYETLAGGNPRILSSLKSLLETGQGLPMGG
jgi:uncharacterized protein YndB with AHSA1/START domain